MRVLRHACRLSGPGSIVLDLTTAPPAASLEVGGVTLGSLDQSTLLDRAVITEAAVDAEIAAGALVEDRSIYHDVLRHFDTPQEAIADIDGRQATRLPDDVRASLRAASSGPVVERSWSLLRRLRVTTR